MIKATYYNGDVIVGTVKFDEDKNKQPLDKNKIYKDAPESWTVCKWEEGEVFPKKAKKTKVVEMDLDSEAESPVE